MAPKIIFEDSSILVLEKPAGMVATPGPGHEDYGDSLAGWILGHVGENLVGVGQENRWGIVHRLDKETSGLMVVAKTDDAYHNLISQFKTRQIEKEYQALVFGIPKEEEFVIDAPLDRHPKVRTKFVVIKRGKEAITRFKKEKIYKFEDKGFGLLLCQPETGRTHQIRVHLKALGFPIVGDPLYSSRKQQRFVIPLLSRMFLHANRLGFRHPETQERVTFRSPLSFELKKFLNVLTKCGD